jgi:hypothetical protein
MSNQFQYDLRAIFPREGNRNNWLTTTNKVLCGYTPQQLLGEGMTVRVHEVLLHMLGNVVGSPRKELSKVHLEWHNREMALQAHRGPPTFPSNSNCSLCAAQNFRLDEGGEAFYCICRYEQLSSYTSVG